MLKWPSAHGLVTFSIFIYYHAMESRIQRRKFIVVALCRLAIIYWRGPTNDMAQYNFLAFHPSIDWLMIHRFNTSQISSKLVAMCPCLFDVFFSNRFSSLIMLHRIFRTKWFPPNLEHVFSLSKRAPIDTVWQTRDGEIRTRAYIKKFNNLWTAKAALNQIGFDHFE